MRLDTSETSVDLASQGLDRSVPEQAPKAAKERERKTHRLLRFGRLLLGAPSESELLLLSPSCLPFHPPAPSRCAAISTADGALPALPLAPPTRFAFPPPPAPPPPPLPLPLLVAAGTAALPA